MKPPTAQMRGRCVSCFMTSRDFHHLLKANSMTLRKTNRIRCKKLILKINGISILKTFSSVKLIIIAAFFTIPVFAQNNKDTAKFISSPNGDDTFKQMLDYSRPNKNHKLLASLTGTWTFQDKNLAFVKGSIVRKSIYDGRFFIVETIGGKLQSPIADGKMKEVNYQGMQIEGYDNVKMKFVSASISNHLGSDIDVQIGTYDSATKVFTYNSESEPAPGTKIKNRRVLKIEDKDHYTEEYYEEQNGIEAKVRELNYTRTKGK
jgi:hypothetical protein